MNTIVRILMLAPPILFGGCRATQDVASTSYHVTRGAAVGSYKVARAVAVGSYRVATAPVYYATRKRGNESSTMVGTETPSDVTNPGQPIPQETPSAQQRQPRVEAERSQGRKSSGTSVMSRKEPAQSQTGVSSSGAAAPST